MELSDVLKWFSHEVCRKPLFLGLILSVSVASCASPMKTVHSSEPRRRDVAEAPPLPLGPSRGGARSQVSPQVEELTLAEDLKGALPTIGNDLVEIYSTPSVWWTLAASYAGGEALDFINAEREVDHYFGDKKLLSDGLSRGFDELGKGYTLLAGAGAWYFIASAQGDDGGLRGSKLLMRSLASTGLSTLVLKSAFSDQRPNGGGGAYPSGHASMTTAAATSLWLSEGASVGLPAAILATLVDVQRLDSRAHELDDIIGGVTMGWLVAKTIHGGESPTLLGARVLPAFSPSGDPGISLLWSY